MNVIARLEYEMAYYHSRYHRFNHYTTWTPRHCWRSRDELISDVLLRTPTYGRAKAGRPARTYIQQLCEDTRCSPEDQPEAINDRKKWRERVRDIRACGTTWWWWGFWLLLERIFVTISLSASLYLIRILDIISQCAKSPTKQLHYTFKYYCRLQTIS